MKKLTARESAFVDAYTGKAEGNGGKAAMMAGYSIAGARVQATRMLKKPNVLAAIVNRRKQIEHAAAEKRAADVMAQQKVTDAMILDAAGRRARLSVIASQGEPNTSIKAIDVLNKMDGVYVEKHEHEHSGGIELTWQQ